MSTRGKRDNRTSKARKTPKEEAHVQKLRNPVRRAHANVFQSPPTGHPFKKPCSRRQPAGHPLGN